MTTTRLETLINHLVDTFPTNGSHAGQALQVVDGAGAADIRNNILMIGHSFVTSPNTGPTFTGSSNQQWATLGHPSPTRREELELNCSLLVGIGNRDLRTCRARAIAIFSSIGDTLRASVAAYTAAGQFQQLGMGRFRLYQDLSNDGVSVVIEFTITATARV